MPYRKVKHGYTTARGGFVKNPDKYEALRREGMSKERAAKIVNAGQTKRKTTTKTTKKKATRTKRR